MAEINLYFQLHITHQALFHFSAQHKYNHNSETILFINKVQMKSHSMEAWE